MSWTPEKGTAKAIFNASVEWNYGPFGTISAKKEFVFDPSNKLERPKLVPIKKLLLK